MTEATGALTLSAAFLAGLAGSGHCFAMCGGLAGALGMRARATAANALAGIGNAVLYQSGRLGGYGLAGALFGSFGASLQSALDLTRLALLLRVAGGVLIMLTGLRILFGLNVLGWLERLGARIWRHLQPLTRHAAANGGVGRTLLLGFLWGWMPCGLVYSMLLFATLSGSTANGAAIMLAFGMGTLPAMLTGTVLAAQLQQWLRHRWPRTISAVALIVFGSWLSWAAVLSQHSGHEHAGIADCKTSWPQQAQDPATLTRL